MPASFFVIAIPSASASMRGLSNGANRKLARVIGIDIVVLDLNMVPIGGFEVLQRIRANADTTLATKPIIVISNSSHADVITRAYRWRDFVQR